MSRHDPIARIHDAYRNDNIVRAVLTSGGDYIDVINELVKDRKRLQEELVAYFMNRPPAALYVREPDGRITVATDLADSPSPTPRECPGHEGRCDMGGVGGSQGG